MNEKALLAETIIKSWIRNRRKMFAIGDRRFRKKNDKFITNITDRYFRLQYYDAVTEGFITESVNISYDKNIYKTLKSKFKPRMFTISKLSNDKT